MFSEKEINDILIKKLPSLSQKDIEDFINITTYFHIEKNTDIIKKGIKTKKAFLILKGNVRGFITLENGTEKNILLRSDGIFVADTGSLFNNQPQRFTYKSIDESHILLFNFNDFVDLTNANPSIMQLYLNILKEAVVRLNYRIESMITMSNEDRYLDLIKFNPGFIDITYSKHLANYLGITPESLSRIRKRIKNKA